MIIPCTNWRDYGMASGGGCAIGVFGKNKTVSCSICLEHCDQYDGPARGRGDLLAQLIKAVTIGTLKPCKDCNGRKHAMNAKHPSKVLAGVAD